MRKMDEYVVGSIADLIAGNLTPSRPASLKRPLTPKKHQPSPRVTPRSEAISGREALLSPTLQRKKDISKKSPKRIFEKEDLNMTAGEIASPKADKVKKHLQDELNSSKNTKSAYVDTLEEVGGTPSKKKKKRNHVEVAQKSKYVQQQHVSIETEKSDTGNTENTKVKESSVGHEEKIGKKKRNKKNKNKHITPKELMDTKTDLGNDYNKESKKKNKKIKTIPEGENENDQENLVGDDAKMLLEEKKKKKKNKKKQNITNEPMDSGFKSESEHESDDEIDSETDRDVKQILDDGPIEGDTSDEETGMKHIKSPKKRKGNVESEESNKLSDEAQSINAEEDDKNRTLFVGNVPLSKKTKKEIKQIFTKYGSIESIRIRAVPVKDMRTTAKVAAIKSEIHPDRTSVNVYVRFADEESVTKALVENNRVLSNHHLRVKRSDTAETHDPRRALFVGNIPLGIEDEVLRAAFEKCGEIESVRIVRDRTTQIGKGFGYVNFASSDGVELALGLSEEDLTIKNRILRIRRYTQAAPGQKVKTKPQRLPNQGQNQGRGPPNRGPNRAPSNRDYSNFRGQNNDGFDSRNRGFGGSKFQGRNNNFPANRGHSFQRDKPKDDAGALRRIKKRKSEDNHGPLEKRTQDADQPVKEKKQKKEFVGMTAEKKKKKKFDKGRKQKQMLSEILTK